MNDIRYHGYAHTHLDSLAHVSDNGVFMLMASPLAVRGGTGSPLNPIAMF